MTDFSFLDNVELTEVQASVTRGGKKANPNPQNADLRVFKSGEVYPSLALVEEFNLEYQPEGSTEVENGFDLINSTDWAMMPNSVPQFLAIAVISKGEARKPHLFGKSRKKEDGTPVHSVADQGSAASGKTLIEYLEEVLNFTFTTESYVDLNIDREHPIVSPNGVYSLPRKQVKGDKAGNLTNIRRENCEIFPLALANEAIAPTEEAISSSTEEELSTNEEVENSTEEVENIPLEEETSQE